MRVITAVVLLVFLLGCGADPFGRLDVNDRLRAACPLWTDAEILALLQASESDRLAGMDQSTELRECLLVCQYMPYPSMCATCMTAVVSRVYGF